MNQYNKRLDLLRAHKDLLYDYLYENLLGTLSTRLAVHFLPVGRRRGPKPGLFPPKSLPRHPHRRNLRAPREPVARAAELPRRGHRGYSLDSEIPKRGKQFNFEFNQVFLAKSKRHFSLSVQQIIIHPGDASAIRAFPGDPHWLLTKADADQAHVWDVRRRQS